MNPVAMLSSQFVQVALPLMVTLTIAAWVNSKGIDGLGKRIDDLRSEMNRRFEDVNRRFEDVSRRFDDVNRQFTEVNRRFDKVDDLLNGHDQRIVRLEERTSPLTRR